MGITSEHPFFIRFNLRKGGFRTDSEGEWREVRDLQVGDEIRLASRLWAKILKVEFKGEGQVYNFEVEGNHNYFVGNSRLLTHNVKWCGTYKEVNKGKPHAEKVFDKVTDGNWRQVGQGGKDVRVGVAKDGRPANFHDSSTQPGRTTIEIGRANDPKSIKRRY